VPDSSNASVEAVVGGSLINDVFVRNDLFPILIEKSFVMRPEVHCFLVVDLIEKIFSEIPSLLELQDPGFELCVDNVEGFVLNGLVDRLAVNLLSSNDAEACPLTSGRGAL
jgi:hypothetical protein